MSYHRTRPPPLSRLGDVDDFVRIGRMPKVGFWYSDDDMNRQYPRVETMVDRSWDPKEHAAVLAYLKGGKVALQCRGWSDCRLCGKMNGSADMTDGTYTWPEGYVHYIEAHGVRAPVEFVRHVLA